MRQDVAYRRAILNLMKALWLLDITKASEEYANTRIYKPKDEIEDQMMKWGMTVEKYAGNLAMVYITP